MRDPLLPKSGVFEQMEELLDMKFKTERPVIKFPTVFTEQNFDIKAKKCEGKFLSKLRKFIDNRSRSKIHLETL